MPSALTPPTHQVVDTLGTRHRLVASLPRFYAMDATLVEAARREEIDEVNIMGVWEKGSNITVLGWRLEDHPSG